MIAPKIPLVKNGQILTANLVNHIIARTEYASRLLREYRCVAGTNIFVEPHYDGTRISSLVAVGGGADGYGGGAGGENKPIVGAFPIITSIGSISVYPNFAIRYQITATNNPQSFNATNLPAGLYVNTSTGLITGYISTVGQYSILLEATNEFGTGTKQLIINVIQRVSTLTLSTFFGGPRATPLIGLSWSHPGAPAGTIYNIYRNDELLAQTTGIGYNDSDIENFTAYRYYLIASTGDISNEVINGCTSLGYISALNYPWATNWSIGTTFIEPTSTANIFYGFADGPYFIKLTTGFGPNPSATADIGNIGTFSTTSTLRISPYKSFENFFGTVVITNNQFPLGLASVGNFEF